MTNTQRPPQTVWQDGPASYCLMSRLNHWITASAFLAALGLGLLLGYGELSREAAAPLMQWHKALGLLVLLWGGWRIVWRIAQGFPRSTSAASTAQHLAAKAVHIGLLTATLAMPVSGVLMSLAGGRDLTVFGAALLPALGDIPWLGTLAEAVHRNAPPVLLLFLILHVGGAMKHHFFDRDTTLARMIRA